jgi:hypothetical protein
MEWRESRKAKGRDELRLGDGVLATLQWAGCFSDRASGRAPQGRWVFDRPGFLCRDVKVWSGESDSPVAVYYPGWLGDGTLEFSDGRSVKWVSTNFWRTHWEFRAPSGETLVRFIDNSRILERTALIERISGELSEQERALLTLFGRYLLELHSRDTVAVVAATTAAF